MSALVPLGAADGDASCASPGWLAPSPPAAGGEVAAAALAERLTLRFEPACARPFVLELELRLSFADRRAPVVRRSAPREFRPGERFLPGEAYLVSRAFPESRELLTALFEHTGCGGRRAVGSRLLGAAEPDPDAGAHHGACVLVVGVSEAARDGAAPSSGARLAVFLAPEPE